MKNRLLLLSVIFTSALLASKNATASGCGWTEKYAVGAKLASQEVSGSFRCRATEIFSYCAFQTNEPEPRALFRFMPPRDQLPPQNVALSVKIDTHEGMEWLDCDGSDPEPPFEKNGIYERFFFGRNEYRRFIPDPGTR